MIKLVLDIIVIVFCLLGMIVMSKELYHHFKQKKSLAEDSFRYRVLLFILGVYILSEKITFVIQEFSRQ